MGGEGDLGMETCKKVEEYRKRFDMSLLGEKLVNAESLKSLVRKQILCSAGEKERGLVDYLVRKRTAEVSDVLDMLRSGAENYAPLPHKPFPKWKVKQDNEKFRAMYRAGLGGTAIHTITVDGYVDAPLDACLYVSFETSLYPIGFPESRFHKLTTDYCKRIRLGEQVALLRAKLAWPLSDRELLLHFSVLEYYEDDLIIVLLNSVSEKENFHKEVDGFSIDEIPKPGNALRVDFVGGVAFQKISDNRSFLRLILDVDIKISYVPKTVVNFVTGKLAATAFRLYDKWVASISEGKGNQRWEMENPLCQRIRDALYLNRDPDRIMETIVLLHDNAAFDNPKILKETLACE